MATTAQDWKRMGQAEDLGERSKLKTDKDFLCEKLLHEFKKHDKYNRGLITAAAFTKVLDDFGLHFGKPEVQYVLKFCTATNEGYVLYKDLITKFSGEVPRAKKSEAANFVLKDNDLALLPTADAVSSYTPLEVDGAAGGGGQHQKYTHAKNIPPIHDHMEMKKFLADQTENIRRLYSRWDRGMITDNSFVTALQEDLEIPLTDEFRRVMTLYGPSRNLSFSKLIQALRIDNILNPNTNRRPPVGLDVKPSSIYSTSNETHDREHNSATYTDHIESGRPLRMEPIARNPITWERDPDVSIQFYISAT